TRVPSYRILISQKFSEDFGKNYEKHDASTSKAFIATVENLPKGKIKDDMMNRYVGFSLTTDEHMEEVYNTFMAEVQNEEYKAKIEEKYNKIKNLIKGKPSPVFAYENHKGGTTALEDLKGKYVYVDVWATWCGPCKAEIPFLKKLEADYHDNNIEFVSISIDMPNAYETWKKMVVEKELGGIQLIADNNWKSKFITDYAIEGIPRFILIDPDGNIVNADAPRPSNDKIRTLFDELKI
ncbi:MAG: TlpA disulfide reductase family protein, partial [Bacteroidota bacterium]